MSRYIKIFIILFLFIFKVSAVSADLNGSLILNPTSPSPYEEITVTLTSYDFDVDNSNISWTINGKPASSGPGVKYIKITTGAVGVAINISARAVVPGGQIFQATMSLVPASVDLTWESPESYVPPFYEGRSLPAEGASVRVNAIPHMSLNGKILSPADVSYAWYKNDEFMETASGRGKSFVDVNLEYLTDVTTVKVIARSSDGSTAVKSIDLYPHNVVPIFYLYDQILGADLSNAITKRFETTQEFTFRFIPFFFSLNNNVGKDASFFWTIDGLPITTENDTTVTLRPKENTYGSRFLGVSLENSSRVLQNTETGLNIVFDTRQ